MSNVGAELELLPLCSQFASASLHFCFTLCELCSLFCFKTSPFSHLLPLLHSQKLVPLRDPARRPRFNASITFPRRIFPRPTARKIQQISVAVCSAPEVLRLERTNADGPLLKRQPLEETIERADGPDRYICFVVIGAYHDEQQVSCIIQ